MHIEVTGLSIVEAKVAIRAYGLGETVEVGKHGE